MRNHFDKCDVRFVLDYAKRIQQSESQIKEFQSQIEDCNFGIRHHQGKIDDSAAIIKQKKTEIADFEDKLASEQKRLNGMMQDLNNFFRASPPNHFTEEDI